MKPAYLFLTALITLPLGVSATLRVPKDALPKLEKSICFGCQLTEAQKITLKELIQKYNHALTKYCSWIWVAQRQNFINRPSKEARYQSQKLKNTINTTISNLMKFYQDAGIPTTEIIELQTKLEQEQQQLICDLATLSLK